MILAKNIFWLPAVLCFLAGPVFGDSAAGYYRSGYDKQAKGDLDGALADYSKAVELGPNDFDTYYARGLVRQNKGDLNGAIADYTRAIEIKPDYLKAYYGRAYARQMKTDWDGAIADYTKVIELKPDAADAYSSYYGRGRAKEAKGDLNGSIADLTKVIELKPDYADAYEARGWQRSQKGDLNGALADYNREIKIKPDSGMAYLNRSRVKKANDDPDGALADYNKAIELMPGLVPFKSDESWVTVASSADGSRLIVGGLFSSYCISTDSGNTWTTNNQPQKAPVAMYGGWSYIAASADGTKFAGICANVIWISTNSGATWFSNKVSGAAYLGSVAFLANGNKMVAVDQGHIAEPTVAESPGSIYMSTNLGVSWTRTTAPAMYWTSVAASADGNRLIAAARGNQDGPIQGGPIYISTNSGVSWKPSAVPFYNQWASVASSADGQKLMAASQAVFISGRFESGSIFTSTNSGMTWKLSNLPHAQWNSVASSADGTSLVAAAIGPTGWIYTSTDSGTTWISNNVPNEHWHSVTLSADGNQWVAVSMGFMSLDRSSIYISRSARHKASRVFAINYELKSTSKNYGPFFEAMKNSPAWHHFPDSTWLVYTSETPAEISNRLSPHLVKGDYLLIIEVRKNFNGSVPKEAWDWINQHAAE